MGQQLQTEKQKKCPVCNLVTLDLVLPRAKKRRRKTEHDPQKALKTNSELRSDGMVYKQNHNHNETGSV